jgi:hypothetical protein
MWFITPNTRSEGIWNFYSSSFIQHGRSSLGLFLTLVQIMLHIAEWYGNITIIGRHVRICNNRVVVYFRISQERLRNASNRISQDGSVDRPRFGTDAFHTQVDSIINIPSNSMQQSPSWEADSSSATQEIPRLFVTRRFIAAFTTARHRSLSWGRTIQSMPPHPISWKYILILSSNLCLGLQSRLLPSGFLTGSLPPYVPHAPTISLDQISRCGETWALTELPDWAAPNVDTMVEWFV